MNRQIRTTQETTPFQIIITVPNILWSFATLFYMHYIIRPLQQTVKFHYLQLMNDETHYLVITTVNIAITVKWILLSPFDG